MPSPKLENALRVSRRYIRSVEAFRIDPGPYDSLYDMLEDFSDGDEVEIIDDALGKMGVIV